MRLTREMPLGKGLALHTLVPRVRRCGSVLALSGLAAAASLAAAVGEASAAPTFSPHPVAVGAAPAAMVSGDLDGDGHKDLVVANAGDDDVSVLLGNGDGSFEPRVDYAVGDNPVAIATGDLDGDQELDLAVANQADDTVSTLIGGGDGTFAPATSLALGAGDGPTSIAIGDLTNPATFGTDGIADLAVATAGSGDVTLVFRDGGGAVASTYSIARPGSTPVAVDAVTTTANFFGTIVTTFHGLVVAYQGSNDLALVPPTNGDFCIAGDFYPTSPIQQSDPCGQGELQPPSGFQAVGLDGGPTTASRVALRGGSKLVEYAVPQEAAGKVGVATLTTPNDGSRPELTLRASLAVPGGPRAVAEGDFAGSSEGDLVVAGATESHLIVTSSAGYAEASVLDVGAVAGAVAGGDFDENGHADFAATVATDDTLTTFVDRWPDATTGAVSDVADGSAVLSGAAGPRGISGSYRFVYGTGASYGSTTAPRELAAGSAAVPVTAALAGLTPGTTYRYRIAVTNAVGTTYGDERTFTTAGSPPRGEPVAPTPRPVDGAQIYGCTGPRLDAHRAAVRAGSRVTLTGSDLGIGGDATIDSRSASVESWSPDRLVVAIPSDARGTVAVAADCGRLSNAVALRVVAPGARGRPSRLSVRGRSVKGTVATLRLHLPRAGRVSGFGRLVSPVDVRLARGAGRLRLRLNDRGRRALARVGGRPLRVKVTLRYRLGGATTRRTVTLVFRKGGSR